MAMGMFGGEVPEDTGDVQNNGGVGGEGNSNAGGVCGPRDRGAENDGAKEVDGPPGENHVGVGAHEIGEGKEVQDRGVRDGGVGAVGIGGGVR